MANTKRVQYVRSTPEFVLEGKYLSPKGMRMMAILAKKVDEDESITPKLRKHLEKEIWAKYGKNRYAINPESVIIKGIIHTTPLASNVAPKEELPPVKSASAEKPKAKKSFLKTLAGIVGMLLIILGIKKLAQ
jgi:hypothetical protein